ncbi:DNA end-binding protein Ku [Bradyrhizobium sp. F1.13.1]
MSEPSRAVRLESGISIGVPRHGPPRELERLPASFPRHLSGRALSRHLRIRKGLVQSAEPKDRPSDQVCQGRRHTGEEVDNEDIVKGYKVDTDTFIELTKEELENVALESTRTIEIDEFVDRSEIDPRYLIRPYYLRSDGKVGHDAFAVIRETIREMNKVAIGRVVLTNREHIIALEPLDKGLMGTLLRYPYEVRSADEYFDDIQDVKVTKDMLDLAKHIVNQKAGHFEPDKFEDQYETALIDLINQKRAGNPITAKARPRGENVVDLMDALRKSIGRDAAATREAPKKPAKKARKATAGQKEMLMPIAGKQPAKEAAKRPAARPQRKSA